MMSAIIFLWTMGFSSWNFQLPVVLTANAGKMWAVWVFLVVYWFIGLMILNNIILGELTGYLGVCLYKSEDKNAAEMEERNKQIYNGDYTGAWKLWSRTVNENEYEQKKYA